MLQESSYNDLYQSTVDAFPRTTKRQHAIDPVRITALSWTPFLGMRTLFLKALAVNEGRHYNPMMLFRNVRYGSGIPIVTNDGRSYMVEQLSAAQNDVSVRCDCLDFFFRFSYYDFLDHSLYGRKRKKYECKKCLWEANPLHLPGLCKHLIKMSAALKDSGILE